MAAEPRTLAPFHYSFSFAMPLDACPFCRDMFERGEASHCPTCGIELRDITKLPPSPTLRHEPEDWDEDLGPEHEKLPALYFPRGRGAVVLLAFVGIGLFLLPWIDMSLPDTLRLSGWDLARRMGWAWGALIAWVVLVPTVASRRTIAALRGARVAAVFLAAIPALTASIVLLFPPQRTLVPVQIQFDWAVYATVLVSLAAVAIGVRLGGKVDVLVAKQGAAPAGELVH
jgi:hypothetical protein